jgi:hypothetical protein
MITGKPITMTRIAMTMATGRPILGTRVLADVAGLLLGMGGSFSKYQA